MCVQLPRHHHRVNEIARRVCSSVNQYDRPNHNSSRRQLPISCLCHSLGGSSNCSRAQKVVAHGIVRKSTWILVRAGFEGRSSRKQGKDLLIEYSRRQGRLILRSRMQSWDVGAELGYWARSEAGRESIANMRGGVKEVLQLLLRYSGATSPRTIGGRRCWPEFGDEEDVRHGSARQIT